MKEYKYCLVLRDFSGESEVALETIYFYDFAAAEEAQAMLEKGFKVFGPFILRIQEE